MEDISKEIHVLMRRREGLVAAFYRVFDPSRLWQEWDEATRRGKRTLAGEGRHFKSYRIPGPGEGSGIDLALNVAKPSFAQGRPGFVRKWAKDCRVLQRLSHPLLPPFEILEGLDDLVLLVMPFCEEPMSLSEQNSSRMSAQIESLRLSLAEAGFYLDDYWQLRSCRGYPFVIDFSELKRIDERLGSRPAQPSLRS